VLTHGLQALGDDMRNKFLGDHERILAWIDNVKKATSPHFDEAHVFLLEVKAQMQSKAAAAAAAAAAAKQGGSEASSKLKFASKL
jgi:glutathione S-transferase